MEPPKTTAQTITRTSLLDGNKYSSHYSAAAKPFAATSATAMMRPNVKDLLATIGLQPEPSPIPVASSTAAPPTTMTRRLSTTSTPTTTTTTPTPTTTTTTSTTTPKPELTPELKDLLQEFGLLTNEEPPSYYTAGPYQDEFQPIVPSSLRDDTLHVNEFKPLPASLSPSLPSSLAPPKKRKMSPEIRSDDFSSFKPLPIPDDMPAQTDADLEELLKSYGLLDGESSRNSKSLTADKRDQSDSIVSTSTEKSEKIPKMMNVPEVNVEFLSPDLMQVLGDMGVKSEQKSKPKTTTAKSRTTQSIPFTSEAATVPSSAATQNDYEKLHLLLDTIKQLDNLNANLTQDELDSLNVRHFNFSDELLAQGPDPLDDYQSYDVRKNEIRRRQSNVEDEDTDDTATIANNEPLKLSLNLSDTPSTASTTTDDKISENDDAAATESTVADSNTISTTAETTTTLTQSEARSKAEDEDETSTTADDEEEDNSTAAPSASSTTSTTEESRNGSLKDLADSFGGDSGLDPVSDEALPAPKRNGFYFFSDWNSFLEVGEDPEKIVVRFDPKVGDSRPFVPVKIP